MDMDLPNTLIAGAPITDAAQIDVRDNALHDVQEAGTKVGHSGFLVYQ